MFFKETPTQLTARAGSLHVQARRDWPPDPDPVDATLTIRPGEPLEVILAGEGPRIIRLHSAHSSVDTGVLRTLSTSEPALVVRPPSGELTFSFASDAERDSVYAALSMTSSCRQAVRSRSADGRLRGGLDRAANYVQPSRGCRFVHGECLLEDRAVVGVFLGRQWAFGHRPKVPEADSETPGYPFRAVMKSRIRGLTALTGALAILAISAPGAGVFAVEAEVLRTASFGCGGRCRR